jgi:uncharacterized damage-inducible protein DinB
MDPQVLVQELKMSKEFFDRATRCLTEEHSGVIPAEGMWTAAQQVAHVAQTVDWFIEGAFRPEGFNMDFEGLGAEVAKVTSLAVARGWLDRAYAGAMETFGSKTPEELFQPLPADGIMGGAPRMAVVSAMADHTAHHRGALTVYARSAGLTPQMPYMD